MNRQAQELVKIAKDLIGSTMTFSEYHKWLDELKAGDEVILRWSAGSFGHYEAKAKLVRVNPKSVAGKLVDFVKGEYGGYPIGFVITVPRSIMDRKFSFDLNSPWPVGVERIAR